ncbi:hypothetical protein ACERII_16100 [Evansella sp. AB-rgal1]|uniref:hypothetical protein n=1 Tax=Evansella sp. AB-rgal1 TaxID=3242696 RepID=UPI00359D48E7
MTTYQMLFLFNPMLFLALGFVIGYLFSRLTYNYIITPAIIFCLSFFVMLFFQNVSFDNFMLVYAIVYTLLSIVGLGFSMLIKKSLFVREIS